MQSLCQSAPLLTASKMGQFGLLPSLKTSLREDIRCQTRQVPVWDAQRNCQAPATLSSPVLIATHGNTGSPTENHSQKHQPSSPCPIHLLSFHSFFLLLSLPHNPQQQPSPPNFGLTQPTVIFQANCNCNQLSLFPWGYFNLYKSIISYHDQPAIHLLSKY